MIYLSQDIYSNDNIEEYDVFDDNKGEVDEEYNKLLIKMKITLMTKIILINMMMNVICIVPLINRAGNILNSNRVNRISLHHKTFTVMKLSDVKLYLSTLSCQN